MFATHTHSVPDLDLKKLRNGRWVTDCRFCIARYKRVVELCLGTVVSHCSLILLVNKEINKEEKDRRKAKKG
jgi:hypothetical protein